LLVIVLFVVFSGNFILEIENTLNSFGLKSRVLNRIINASFFDNADRSNIQKMLMPYIFDNFFGHGLYADRFLTAYGKYAHNFFLELLIDFGVIAGGGMIIAIIISTVRAILLCVKKQMNYAMYFVIYSIVYIYFKFMISASYLESSECFFAIGIIVNIIRNKNNGVLNNEK